MLPARMLARAPAVAAAPRRLARGVVCRSMAADSRSSRPERRRGKRGRVTRVGGGGRLHLPPPARKGCHVRLATYNVLCSELGDPKYFTNCKPSDLDADTRFSRILSQLRTELQRGAVVCLQEVSRSWASRLHAFFAQNGYHFIVDTYSEQKSGYMGVGIAIPTSQYDIVLCDMRRVADTGPLSSAVGNDDLTVEEMGPQPTVDTSADEAGAGFMARTAQWFGITGITGITGDNNLAARECPSSFNDGDKRSRQGNKCGPENIGRAATQSVLLRDTLSRGSPWELAMRRNNVLIFVRLCCVRSGVTFSVATYHMPCMYWAPRAMLIQAVRRALCTVLNTCLARVLGKQGRRTYSSVRALGLSCAVTAIVTSARGAIHLRWRLQLHTALSTLPAI